LQFTNADGVTRQNIRIFSHIAVSISNLANYLTYVTRGGGIVSVKQGTDVVMGTDKFVVRTGKV
jgi:hypothetical protein